MQGQLESQATVAGVKGKLVEWINKLAELLPDEG